LLLAPLLGSSTWTTTPGFDAADRLTAGQPTWKRAELYGILSFLTFIRLVMEYFKISPTVALQIHCDDKNTINEIAAFRDMQQYDTFATTKRCFANYDLIDEILLCFNTLPMTVRIQYVKGHQDKRCPPEELPNDAQLNCIAHELCSQQLQRLVNASAPFDNPGHFPHHQCSVLHNNRRITGPLHKRLKVICATPHIERYWRKRFDWSMRDIDNLERRAFSRVYLLLPKSDQRRVLQFRCGWLPVNKRCCKWMKDRTETCPCCNSATESVDHLVTCWDNKHPTGEIYTALHSSMTEAKFHPDISSLGRCTQMAIPKRHLPGTTFSST
jgi:hypothetical protein